MKNLKIIYTFEIQDGENRYTLHSPQSLNIIGKDNQLEINEFGENLAKEYYGNTETEPNGSDWYEIDGGCRAIRYKSFEIIESEETFKLIERILYK